MNDANIRITIYRQHRVDGPGPPHAFIGDDEPAGEGWFINARAELPPIENNPPRLLLLGRAFLIYSMYHAREPRFLAMAMENFRAAARKLGSAIPLTTKHANWLTYGPEGLEPATPEEYRALFKQISRTFGPEAAKQQAAALNIEWPRQVTAAQMAEQRKREIIDDVIAGTVPVTVTSYGDLHDHVDANCYGGTETLLDELDDATPDTDDGHWSAMEALWAIANPAMEIVDAWIKSGGLREAVRDRQQQLPTESQ